MFLSSDWFFADPTKDNLKFVFSNSDANFKIEG